MPRHHILASLNALDGLEAHLCTVLPAQIQEIRAMTAQAKDLRDSLRSMRGQVAALRRALCDWRA